MRTQDVNVRRRIMKIEAVIAALLLITTTGCFSKLLKPVSYNAAFEVIDTSNDGIITIDEFTSHFPESDNEFPEEADADNDGRIYPDEWFEYREKKGYQSNAR